MRHARRLLSYALAGSLALIPAWLPAQAPVSDLIATLRSSPTDAQRWNAAIALGTATFSDAAERDAARLALQEALASREAGLRVNAATALGKLGDPRSVDVLARALFDPNALVRQAASRALGRIGDENAARALLAGLRDPNLMVRAQVVRALGETRQSLAISALEPILLAKSDEPNAPLRAEAAKALEAMGSFGVSALERGLDNGDPTVRFYAARSLGNIGNPTAISALVKRFDDPNPAVVAESVSAAGRLGEPAIPRLLEALDSSRANVRLNAAKALGVIGSPAVGPLRNLYNTAIARIAELNEERAVALAVSEAQRPRVVLPPTTPPETRTTPPDTGEDAFGTPPMTDAEIRREVARLKARMKSIKRRTERAEELVRLRLREEGYNQRYNAAQAYLTGEEQPKTVSGAGNVGVQPFLVPIPEREPQVSLPSAPAGDRGATPTLPTTRPLRLIDQEIETLSRRAQMAILALGSIGNDEAVAALGEIVRQGELEDAAVAVEALSRTRNPNAVAILADVLGDTAYATSIRANAASGLGRFRTNAAKNALEQAAANDPSPTVRQIARSALADVSASVTP